MPKEVYCPCSSKHLYSDCCQPYHINIKYPNIAEQLMRSRYSAYAFNLTDYIIRTWHSSTCPQLSTNELVKTIWVKLIINKCWKDDKKDEAFVEFDAFYEQNGQLNKLHEISRFIKNNDKQWLYIDGKLS